MKKHNFYIVKSVRVQISHTLFAKKGVKLSEINTVYSHEQALSQCAEHLKALGVKTVAVENTAVAAKEVAESGRTDIAAISSESAAEKYGLNVLESHINDSNSNTTRFAVLTRSAKAVSNEDNHFIMMFTA